MRRSGDYLERVSDHEFHVRAVACPHPELREESSAVLSAHEDVESPFDLGVVMPSTVTVYRTRFLGHTFALRGMA